MIILVLIILFIDEITDGIIKIIKAFKDGEK